MDLFITAVQVSDYIGGRAPLRSLPKDNWLLGDRGFDANWLQSLAGVKDTHLHARAIRYDRRPKVLLQLSSIGYEYDHHIALNEAPL